MPSWVTQIVTLFQDATKWVLYVAAPAVALMAAYHAVAKGVATDEMVAAQHQRALVNTLKYGVIALISVGLVTTVLGYFK